jgi:hypothetical protein
VRTTLGLRNDSGMAGHPALGPHPGTVLPYRDPPRARHRRLHHRDVYDEHGRALRQPLPHGAVLRGLHHVPRVDLELHPTPASEASVRARLHQRILAAGEHRGLLRVAVRVGAYLQVLVRYLVRHLVLRLVRG